MFGITPFADGYQQLPRLTRHTVSKDLMAAAPLAVIAGVMNYLFCGLVARKALHMPDALLSLLLACNMLGLILAAPLVGWFRHKNTIHVLIGLVAGAACLLIAIAVVVDPVMLGSVGASVVYLVLMTMAQVAMASIITLRTAIWRANYPEGRRARIVVIITLVTSLVSSFTIMTVTRAMDQWGVSYRVIYVVTGVVGLAAAGALSKIRIRHEKSRMRRYQSDRSVQTRLFAGLTVLKSDKRFRHYMGWQMLNGFSAHVMQAALVVILTDAFETNWFVGGSALLAAPMVTQALSSLVWAKFFDRHHILSIRVVATLVWSVSGIVLAVGVWQHSIAIIVIGRIITGIGMGGGQLAWRLGHMGFARAEQDSLYMGAHVSLTGLRGVIAPFVGIYLYRHGGLGRYGELLILLTAIGQIAAAAGFAHMKKTFAQAAPVSSYDRGEPPH